jgi:hypothetical protein
LAGKPKILAQHIAEAIQFRSLDKQNWGWLVGQTWPF